MVDLVGSGAAQPNVRAMGVVPGDVEGLLLPESRETERDQDQPSRALRLEGSDATLDHREAAVLPDGSESVLNPSAVAPTAKSPWR